MKKGLLYIYLLALLLPAGFSCSSRDACTGEVVSLFYREEAKFQELVELLRADSVAHRRQGRLLFWKTFPNHTKRRLQELGITHVRLYEGELHVDLKTHCSATHPVYLCYRDADRLPAQHEPFTLLHQLNASWMLYTKPRS